jgi:hypothetical protein
MMDDDQQGRALREGLDRELAGVHATAEARERLSHRTAARSRSGSGLDRPHLRSRFAVPLAAAVLLIGVVAVPTLLRNGPAGSGPQGGSPTTAGSNPAQTPTASPFPSATAAPQPTSRPRPTAVPTPTWPSATGFAIAARPSTAVAGERVAITLINVPTQRGDIVVNWGDGSAKTTVSGACGRRQPAPGVVAHSYRRAGTYRVTAELDRCGSRGQAGFALTVLTSRASAAVPAATATRAPLTSGR